jgi:hypothetical protein
MADFKEQAGRGWTAHGPTSHQWTKARKIHGERRSPQDSAKVSCAPTEASATIQAHTGGNMEIIYGWLIFAILIGVIASSRGRGALAGS